MPRAGTLKHEFRPLTRRCRSGHARAKPRAGSLGDSIGFAISFGILVAAFVMAMFFTPSLTALIGHAAWWPGHCDDSAEREAERSTVAVG